MWKKDNRASIDHNAWNDGFRGDRQKTPNSGNSDAQASVRRYRAEHRVGGPAGRDSIGGVLSWLAGFAPKPGQACRAGNHPVNEYACLLLDFWERAANAQLASS
jgi:hypothetical protein